MPGEYADGGNCQPHNQRETGSGGNCGEMLSGQPFGECGPSAARSCKFLSATKNPGFSLKFPNFKIKVK